jgi:hypothetical protein
MGAHVSLHVEGWCDVRIPLSAIGLADVGAASGWVHHLAANPLAEVIEQEAVRLRQGCFVERFMGQTECFAKRPGAFPPSREPQESQRFSAPGPSWTILA